MGSGTAPFLSEYARRNGFDTVLAAWKQRSRSRVVTNPADVSDDENFNGGFYELAVEVGATDDDRLWRTADAVWRHAGIEGCQRRFPPPPEPVPRSLDSLNRFGHLNGILRLPDGGLVVC